MEIFFFWWPRLKALILIFNVCRREHSTIYSMFNWSMGLFLLYSHILSLFFKKNRTHQVELVSWWWLFGEARTTHQTIYQSWGGGIIRLWNVVKVTFWKQSFNTTAFSGIYLLLMSECSSMAQGGEKGESIEDLVCFFFNKISTSISPASSFGSILRSFVICFCFNYPASRTSSSLNFSVKFDWITSSGDLGNEGGAWSARAEHYFWNYSY